MVCRVYTSSGGGMRLRRTTLNDDGAAMHLRRTTLNDEGAGRSPPTSAIITPDRNRVHD